MIIYELVSENLTGLGGPMGTEETWENFREHYATQKSAMNAAEEDYKKQIKGLDKKRKPEKIRWIKHNSEVSTQCLISASVRYWVKTIEVKE